MSHRLACGCVISDALLNTLCVCGNRGQAPDDPMDWKTSGAAEPVVVAPPEADDEDRD